MQIGVVGINFKTADLALRETIARAAESLSGERGLFFPHPTVLLSTCNRTEVYFSAPDLAAAQSDLIAWLRFFVRGAFEQRLYSYFGMDCFVHLCKVTAGLDSAIFAETEVQRQVKLAYLRSCERFSLPSSLHYAFQKALQVGKKARSHLQMERGSPTLYGTLWKMAASYSEKILLVGYSEINRGFAAFLARKKVTGYTFCTRAKTQIEGGVVKDRGELDRWQEYDLILSSTKADGFLIQGTARKRTLIFDLSVPRTVDPKVGQCEAVCLYNIEEIHRLIERDKEAQERSFAVCERQVWEHASRLFKSPHGRGSEERALRLECSPSR